MPIMNGPTASRHIRELGYKGMIIGLTGHALSEDVRDYLNSGADKVIVKPLRREVLFGLITEMENMEAKSLAVG